MTIADFIIIGGGIAGASAGYELCRHGKVILLEKENLPGYHTTGRSSAIFQKSYNRGDPLLNILVSASEDFLHAPPAEFAAHSLLTPRPLIYIAPPGQQDRLDDLRQRLVEINVATDFIAGQEIADIIPALSPDYQARALLEQGLADIDVGALHGGYLQGITARGSSIMTNAGVTGLIRNNDCWQVTTKTGQFQAPVVINAAGAWVDRVAGLADIAPIGIRPLRRTVIMVTLPGDICPDNWPIVMDVSENYYFKPEGGKILMTPGDATLSPPCDAQPEEIDIAWAAHYLEQATSLTVGRIERRWAGLRNHVADNHPVAGFDPDAPGFFWLAGQGGFGIKTAPAMGRIAAALITGGRLPQDMVALGLSEERISVKRLR